MPAKGHLLDIVGLRKWFIKRIASKVRDEIARESSHEQD